MKLTSFLLGAGAGYLGYKLLTGGALMGPRRSLGLTRFYPYKVDWDSENRAKAIMQSLARIPAAKMGDMPSSFYGMGGEEGLPAFGGDPTFLVPYDPDGPKTPLWMWGFPIGGRVAPPPP